MSFTNPFDVYSDSRTHPPPGPSRNSRLPKVTLPGGGLISKGEDGRIAVAGRECPSLFFYSTSLPSHSSLALRILRILDSSQSTSIDPKHPNRPAFKIESTRNLWEGSGLKIDCASTDVAWAYGGKTHTILPYFTS